MLTEIVLENCKGYQEKAGIPLAPITLLYGPNSAGKSSIFRALLFIYEVLKNDWTLGTIPQIQCEPSHNPFALGQRIPQCTQLLKRAYHSLMLTW